jgi:hypothetical protein
MLVLIEMWVGKLKGIVEPGSTWTAEGGCPHVTWDGFCLAKVGEVLS